MNRRRVRSLVFWSTVALALLLMLLPLPASLEALKPYWPALVLVYWALESSDIVGLGLAFGSVWLPTLSTGSCSANRRCA